MKKIPNKYKKHMALVLFGFKTQEELDRDLARYGVNEAERIKEEILAKMKSSKTPRTYILSLIPRDEATKLPHKVIKLEEDLDGISEFISSYPRAEEVWKFEKEQDSIIGRFSIGKDGSQTIEQIWSSNHRALENYDAHSGVPIIRASRERWYTPYNIDSMQAIPEGEEETVKKRFFEAVFEIERNREKIEIMLEECKKREVDELALEYRIDSTGFAFIDWDTSNDRRLLSHLFDSMHDDREGR